MKNLRFTKEEKKDILEALELILIDIEKLWDKVKSTTDEIFVYIFEYEDFYGFDDKKLVVNDLGIKLVDDHVIGQPQKEIWLRKKQKEEKEKSRLFKKKEQQPEPDFNLYYNLIRNYKKHTRPKLIEKITHLLGSKKEGLNSIKDVRREYSKTASIELIFQTQNQIPIEVTKENNKTIGTLRFGGNIIKLVTNGDIVIKDNQTSPQKKK